MIEQGAPSVEEMHKSLVSVGRNSGKREVQRKLPTKQCKICQYSTPHGGSFKEHLKTHGEKTYKCAQCDFASVSACGLRQHLKAHSVKKTFNCTQCNKAFAGKGTLKKHLKRHSGKKSYRCDQCEYASVDAGGLQKHMKTHTREKAYKCDQCTFAFAYAADLKNHFKTRQSKQCGFSIYIFDNSNSKSMVRLVRSEKMALSGLVFARKIARMILIQNI